MKKNYFYILIIITAFFVTNFYNTTSAVPNPWIDCNDDISCGAKKAGFNLPIRVKNYNVRAMKGLLEINFPLDKKRSVSLRKSETYEGNLSGVYENYPVNKTLSLNNGVMFNVRGKKNKFFVADFAAETGYYSFYSKQGMKTKDINYIYNLLAEAEAPRCTGEEVKTIEQLQEQGIWVYGCDMDGTSVYGTDLKGPAAIVIGNEGRGISRLVRDKCDFIISIPMKGQINSLNASNAAAIVTYEALRQREK